MEYPSSPVQFHLVIIGSSLLQDKTNQTPPFLTDDYYNPIITYYSPTRGLVPCLILYQVKEPIFWAGSFLWWRSITQADDSSWLNYHFERGTIHKFRDFFFVGFALQRLSDIICLEHGLSVIEKKKPSKRVKRTTYPEKKSFRDDIRDVIDQIRREGGAKDFNELLYKLEHAFYDNEKAEKQPKTHQRKKEEHGFNLLIDIQKKLAQGKGKY